MTSIDSSLLFWATATIYTVHADDLFIDCQLGGSVCVRVALISESSQQVLCHTSHTQATGHAVVWV